MNRRDFIRRSTLVGAVAGAGLAVPHRTGASASDPSARSRSSLAEQPADGDPLALQRSTLVVNGLDPSELTERYVGMLTEAGVGCWLRSRASADVRAFAEAYTFLDAHRDRVVAATTVSEIREAHRDGRLAQIFGWQSANDLGDAPGDPPPTSLRAYYQLGLRVVGIAYNVANIFGGGCLEPRMGLTRAGRHLVEEIHKLRIVLDLNGHTSEQTSLDAIEMSAGLPVVCSHTNVAALNDNPRCSSDRLFEAVARTGGVIGLTAFNDFHAHRRSDAHVPRTPQVGLATHLDHFDYLRRLVGAEHIGLGPDFIEGRLPRASVNPAVSPPEIYSAKPWLYVEGFERITELPNVTRGLIERGWSEAEVRQVLGENWLRVYEQVWGG